MLKPWFLNLLLVVALVAAAGRFIDVVGQRPDTLPEVAPAAPAPRVPALARPQTQIAEFQDVVDKNLFDADRGQAEPVAATPPPGTPSCRPAAEGHPLRHHGRPRRHQVRVPDGRSGRKGGESKTVP